MKRIFQNHKRKVLTVVLTLPALCVIAIPFFLKNVPIVGANTSKIEIMESISQIVAAVYVVAGSVIAVWQYYISSKSEIIKNQTDKVQKAIDLSEYYKNEVLHPYSIIREVYSSAGIFGFLQKERLFTRQYFS